MKKKFIFLIAAFLFVSMMAVIDTKAFAADEIKWNTYEEGLSLAEKQNKKIFINFHAAWCTFCKKLKKTTFKNQKVIEYLNKYFINISVNSDKEKNTAKKFGVRGLPTLFFLKPNSNMITGRPGFLDAELFLKILKFIHTDNYQKMPFSEYVKTL
ncbi:MAG: thioredoxin fold domain-containing protein [Desulfobacula sp.]|uniref:thioredoxin family protein n=1 Tax=Desulfobacula sp. TaxID=2593537 RepID=UPI0025C6D661|nr:thioredoxin fold domain-containing protein [Desulfobacula sp.]MCD4722730.1 thioredoxin fold domain-containing protein [Desulfobacula sp.]